MKNFKNKNKSNKSQYAKARIVRVSRRPVRTQGHLPIQTQTVDYYTEMQYSQQLGFTFSPTRTELDVKSILLASQEYELLKKNVVNLRVRWVTVVITIRDGIYTGLHPPRLAMYGDNYSITDAMVLLNKQYPTVYVNSPKTQKYRFYAKEELLTNKYKGYVDPEDPTPLKIKLVTTSVVPVTQPLPNIATIRVSINLSCHRVDNIDSATVQAEPSSELPLLRTENEERGAEDSINRVAGSKGPQEPSEGEPHTSIFSDVKQESAKIDASTSKEVQILLKTIHKLKQEIDELRSKNEKEPSA